MEIFENGNNTVNHPFSKSLQQKMQSFNHLEVIYKDLIW